MVLFVNLFIEDVCALGCPEVELCLLRVFIQLFLNG